MTSSTTPQRPTHNSTHTDAPPASVSRRTVTQGLAWSVPVFAAAVAAPLASASVACVEIMSTSTATFTRTSATAAVFTWTDLFGDGKDFTLTLAAIPNGGANMAINTTNNLTLDSATAGGEALPSVRLSLDTLTLANGGGGERVNFSFALDGVASSVDDLSYKIKDIDGVQALDGNGGAERVYVSQGTGTFNSTWIAGQGIGSNPWKSTTTAPNAEVIPTSSAGNVAVTTTSVSSFDLTFIANNSGRAPADRPNQNIWIGPFAFTAINPSCTA